MNRILLVHRYYKPDTPTYAILLDRIAQTLQGKTQVHVLTAMPSYYGSSKDGVQKKEVANGVRITRLGLFDEGNRKYLIRVVNSVLFALKVFIYLIRHRNEYDVVQVATTPPIMISGVTCIATALLNRKFVYHCQDIYPEIAHTLSKTNERMGMGYRIMRYLDKGIMRRASAIVVLSEDMSRALTQGRSIDSSKIWVINNFITADQIRIVEPIEKLDREIVEFTQLYPRTFVFSGNIGIFQDLDRICKAFSELPSVGFMLIGTGQEKARLEQEYADCSNIYFSGYMQQSKLNAHLHLFEAGLAPIQRDVERFAFPSKIIGYLSQGLPVISFSSENSSIAVLCSENEFGINSTLPIDGSMDKFKAILEEFENGQSHANIRERALTLFGENEILQEWIRLYESV